TFPNSVLTMKGKNESLRILFLEENEAGIRLVDTILKHAIPEVELKTAKTEKEFLKFIIRFQPAVIISGYHLQKYSATEAFKMLRQEEYLIPFIIITDKLSEDVSNELIRNGVEDCMSWSNLTRLPQVIARAVDKKNMHTQKETAEYQLKRERGRLQT